MSDLPEWCILVITGVIVFCITVYGIECLRYAKNKTKQCKQIQDELRKIDFHPGDVVQTKDGFDRGLVIRVDENNIPTEIMSSPGLNMRTGERTETRYYGGVDSVTWYKTGEHMTAREWNNLYTKEEGWQKYCEDRNNQIKFNNEGQN